MAQTGIVCVYCMSYSGKINHLCWHKQLNSVHTHTTHMHTPYTYTWVCARKCNAHTQYNISGYATWSSNSECIRHSYSSIRFRYFWLSISANRLFPSRVSLTTCIPMFEHWPAELLSIRSQRRWWRERMGAGAQFYMHRVPTEYSVVSAQYCFFDSRDPDRRVD